MKQARLETMSQRGATDHDGRRWAVREVRTIEVAGAPSETCLIFDSESICRRLWTYPELWMQLSDAALLELMEQPR